MGTIKNFTNMGTIKNFTNWLNENLNFHFNVKYPWEEKISEKIDEIEKIHNILEDDFEYNRYGQSRNGVWLNIKVYDGPDTEEISKKYDLTEEEIDEYYRKYLDETIETFCEGLELHWLKDYVVGGRSGGWLGLIGIDLDDIEVQIEEKIDEYQYEMNALEIGTVSVEEFQRILKPASVLTRTLGLGSAERAEKIIEAVKYSEDCTKGLEKIRKEWNEILEDLRKIEKEKDEIIKDLAKNFDNWMEEQKDQ